jgi:hypothetical protein
MLFRDIKHWLCTNNPFYLISAALVFAGLRISFAPPNSNAWALTIGVAAFTLLLAMSGFFLVRFGKLWDDARSILLLVVLLLAVLSESPDEVLVANFRHGLCLNLAGWFFAVCVSETLLQGLGIRFNWRLRVPFHAFFAVLFLYPVALTYFEFKPNSDALHWGLLGFSLATAGIVLSLVSAAHVGAPLVANNGTPWRWPLFPWPVFAALTLFACWRSYSLCIALDAVGGTAHACGPYFLAPLCLAVAFVLNELALQSRRRWGTQIALVVAAMAPALTILPRGDLVYDGFLQSFIDTTSVTPWYIMLCATAVYYAIGILRRVRGSFDSLSICLGYLSVSRPDGFGPSWDQSPSPTILLLIALLQLALVVIRGKSRSALAAGWCVLAAGYLQYGMPLSLTFGSMHALVIVALIVAALFDDWLARSLRGIGAMAILMAAWHWHGGDITAAGDWPGWLTSCYGFGLFAFALAYGWWVGEPLYYVVASLLAIVWLGDHGIRLYRELRQRMPGVDLVLGGLLFFVLAMLVSLNKIGISLRRLARRSG